MLSFINLNALATYLATEQHLASSLPWHIIANVVSMISRPAAALFADTGANR